MAKLKVGVLISGRGSNMAALIEAGRAPGYPAEIACVLSNVASAPGLELAQAAAVPTAAISHKSFADRESFDRALSAELDKHGIELVAEAGFMRIHSPWFAERWKGRLLNIHPSLLPAFPGLRVQQQAIDAGVRISGCTVHFVTAELDAGPIIAQAAVPVLPDDTAEMLAERILRQEHRLYPQVVRWFAEDRVHLDRGRVLVTGAPTLLFSSQP
ncbi:MAG: phosphoribosylglycinamide formyltransferase [Alphaproteobacteria bacterium]|nr:phosphoribosylglycinamide formyltransferase [Alphaproteobacteria bacterium]